MHAYDPLSKIFHWGTAVLVLGAFLLGPEAFGHLLEGGVDPGSLANVVWHESLGVTVFVITVLRLIWLALRPGAPGFEVAPWARRISRLMHVTLWALLLALPLSALLALGAEGVPLTLLGGIRIDDLSLIAASHLSGLAAWGDVHKFLGDAIIWLAGAHACVALYHHFSLKDEVLESMLP